MTEQSPDDYLRRFERGLKGLPRSERSRIVKEIRSHIDGRGPDAIDGFGDPGPFARSFVEDYHAAREATLGAGGDRRAGGPRRPLADAFGLMVFTGAVLVAAVLYFVGVAGGAFAIGKFAAPHHIGCYTAKHAVGGEFNCYFGNNLPVIPAGASDSGLWVAPLAGVVAALAFALATWLLLITARRFVIRPVFDAYRAARRDRQPLAGVFP
jgi:hypothetical protein